MKSTYSSPTCLRIQKHPDMQGYASKQGDSILPSFLAPGEVRIVKSLVAIWPVAGGRAETPSSLERSHHCSGLSIVAVMRQGLCRLSAEERKKKKEKKENDEQRIQRHYIISYELPNRSRKRRPRDVPGRGLPCPSREHHSSHTVPFCVRQAGCRSYWLPSQGRKGGDGFDR